MQRGIVLPHPLHLKFHHAAFRQHSLKPPSCQKDSSKLETIYLGNFKCYWKTFLKCQIICIVVNQISGKKCNPRYLLFSSTHDMGKYFRQSTLKVLLYFCIVTATQLVALFYILVQLQPKSKMDAISFYY